MYSNEFYVYKNMLEQELQMTFDRLSVDKLCGACPFYHFNPLVPLESVALVHRWSLNLPRTTILPSKY